MIYVSYDIGTTHDKILALPESTRDRVFLKNIEDYIDRTSRFGFVINVLYVYNNFEELGILKKSKLSNLYIFTDPSTLSSVLAKLNSMKLDYTFIKVTDKEELADIQRIFKVTQAKAKHIKKQYETIYKALRDYDNLVDLINRKAYIPKPKFKATNYDIILRYLLGDKTVSFSMYLESVNKYKFGCRKVKEYMITQIDAFIDILINNKPLYKFKDGVSKPKVREYFLELDLTAERLVILKFSIEECKTGLDLLLLGGIR